MKRRPRGPNSGGFVLVAVLGGLLVVAAVAFALVFTASLDALAARARTTSVVASETVQAALTLAVAEALQQHAGGLAPGPGQVFGPWPELGVPAQVVAEVLAEVAAEALPDEDEGLVVRFTATLPAEPTRAAQVLIVRLQPKLELLRRH